MKAQEIINLAAEKKIVRASDFDNQKITLVYLARLVERGQLVRVGRGLYTLPDANFNEYQSLLEVARLVPQGVICLLSALRFHDLTTQNPFEIWLAIPRESHTPQVKSLQLRVFRVSEAPFTAGIQKHEIDGIELKVYSAAKTVADCFKYRNKVGLDVAIEALRDARRARKASIDEIHHFARICRVEKVMMPYFEAVV